jgi:hypothetical protein
MSDIKTQDSPKILSDLREIGIEMHDYRRPIYKYTSAETAKIILEKCSIRFRVPSTFNDPFEFYLDLFDTSLSSREFKDNLDAIMRRDPNMSATKRKGLLQKTSINFFKKTYRELLELQRERSMVFCASAINNDILMWSHYANCHKGVCLGIMMPPIVDSLDCITMRVNYTDVIKPKKFYTQDLDKRHIAVMYWVFTKAACWSYEKEIRSFIRNETNQLKVNKDKCIDVELQPSQLTEIYFGLETSDKDISDIQSIVREKGYPISVMKRMTKVKRAFALTTA